MPHVSSSRGARTEGYLDRCGPVILTRCSHPVALKLKPLEVSLRHCVCIKACSAFGRGLCVLDSNANWNVSCSMCLHGLIHVNGGKNADIVVRVITNRAHCVLLRISCCRHWPPGPRHAAGKLSQQTNKVRQEAILLNGFRL